MGNSKGASPTADENLIAFKNGKLAARLAVVKNPFFGGAFGPDWRAKAPVSYQGLLILAACETDEANENGATALMIAAESNRVDWIEALLAAGARPGAKDRDGEQALTWAARAGCEEALRALLPVSDALALGIRRETALSAAAEAGQEACVALLAGRGARMAGRFQRTPLILAALGDHARCVELLLPHSDPDARDVFGQSALTAAVSQWKFQSAASLLRACDADLKNGWGASALEMAANPQLVGNLVSQGAVGDRARFLAELEAHALLKEVAASARAGEPEPAEARRPRRRL